MQNSIQPKHLLSMAVPDSSLICVRAFELEQIECALRIAYASYCQRGLILPNRAQLWITRHHLLTRTRVLLAIREQQAKGTLTFVEDGPAGIPMDSLFKKEVDRCRQADRRIAEATCLALDERGTLAGLEVVNLLMGAVAQAAYRAGIAQILITVHPRHARYYTRMAGFSPLGPARPYPAVRGHLALPLMLNLLTLHKTNPSSYRRYFGMNLPQSTLAPTPTPHSTVQHLSRLWQLVQAESSVEAFPAGRDYFRTA